MKQRRQIPRFVSRIDRTSDDGEGEDWRQIEAAAMVSGRAGDAC